MNGVESSKPVPVNEIAGGAGDLSIEVDDVNPLPILLKCEPHPVVVFSVVDPLSEVSRKSGERLRVGNQRCRDQIGPLGFLIDTLASLFFDIQFHESGSVKIADQRRSSITALLKGDPLTFFRFEAKPLGFPPSANRINFFS